jgi:hypothetical protein
MFLNDLVESASGFYADVYRGHLFAGAKKRKNYIATIQKIKSASEDERKEAFKFILEDNDDLPVFTGGQSFWITAQNRWISNAQEGKYLPLPEQQWYDRFLCPLRSLGYWRDINSSFQHSMSDIISHGSRR